MKTRNAFRMNYGPWALVTGASSGIGAEFARQLARKGLNIVLVARGQAALEEVATRIRVEHKIEARTVVADLATEAGIRAVQEAVGDLDVGLLVNNAGREDSGYSLQTPIEQTMNTIALNITAPMALTHGCAQAMVKRKKSGLIFMSSLVAFQGVPLIANYAGSKAYNLVFAESLAAEFKQYNIDVAIGAPGFTNTKLASGFDFSRLPKPMSPAKVASDLIRSLGKRRVTVSGALNKFLYFSGKYLLPRKLNSFSFGQVFKTVLRKKLAKASAEGGV